MEDQTMKENENNNPRELNLNDLSLVVGGTDYSYAYPIIGEIRVRFKTLVASGAQPEAARKQVKAEYWSKVLDICRMYPDDCGIEKQAQVIFMFVIGS